MHYSPTFFPVHSSLKQRCSNIVKKVGLHLICLYAKRSDLLCDQNSVVRGFLSVYLSLKNKDYQPGVAA